MGETAHAPLGGASPPVLESASEEEEPPLVADCTSLPLADVVQGELASLLGENQVCGNEPEVPGEDTFPAVPAPQNEKFSTLVENEDLGVEPEVLGEDTFPAAPVAQNQKSSTYAEMKLHSEQEYFPSLPAGNLIYRTQPENLHELIHYAPQVKIATTSTKNGEHGTGSTEQGEINYNLDVDKSSATAPPMCEKWSLEAIAFGTAQSAIAQRSQRRPARTARLNTAKTLGENRGFKYLQECWEEDPALQIVIKKLLAKFPQWGIACVDGVLVNWDQ